MRFFFTPPPLLLPLRRRRPDKCHVRNCAISYISWSQCKLEVSTFRHAQLDKSRIPSNHMMIVAMSQHPWRSTSATRINHIRFSAESILTFKQLGCRILANWFLYIYLLGNGSPHDLSTGTSFELRETPQHSPLRLWTIDSRKRDE